MEDYLKVIYQLERGRDDRIRTSEIADELDVTSPTVTSMLETLAERGLLDREKYNGVTLTEEGETVAIEVVRHHRLLEAYLAEHLDYDWAEVHDEADRLEHHISENFEERLAAALDDPDVDPHGSPIPSADLEAPCSSPGESVSAFEPGETVVVEEVADEDPEVLSYLADRGVEPAVELEIIERAPFGMITARAAGADRTISLPEDVAAHVRVRRPIDVDH